VARAGQRRRGQAIGRQAGGGAAAMHPSRAAEKNSGSGSHVFDSRARRGGAGGRGRARLSDYGALRHRAGLYAAAPPPRGDERPRGVCVSPACWLWAAPHRWVK
jgi:hypothetical protein